MRKILLFPSVLLWSLVFLNTSYGQADPFMYAVTDRTEAGNNWTVLRKLDTRTGQISGVLLDGSSERLPIFDPQTDQRLARVFEQDTNPLFRPELAFGSGVAAIAYDRKSNRVFYTQMYVDQLRYVDLNTMKVYCVGASNFGHEKKLKVSPGNAITRMVIAGDGNGYCISGSDLHLYRFTTGINPAVTDLGQLIDAGLTNETTIQNSCGNAGGDMIADDEGNLYLITAQNKVYKVYPGTLKAAYLGKIRGLPEKFSTNGAAVDHNGNIVVSSSVYRNAWYRIDPVTWSASEFRSANGVFNSADLASSNLLISQQSNSLSGTLLFQTGKSSLIRMYPNPAQQHYFTMRFSNMIPGDYMIRMTDIQGRNILQKKINIALESHTETVRISENATKGFYLVQVMNDKNEQVFSEKLLVKQVN
jgi:hypothetical protein